jgi:hypothetical protein
MEFLFELIETLVRAIDMVVSFIWYWITCDRYFNLSCIMFNWFPGQWNIVKSVQLIRLCHEIKPYRIGMVASVLETEAIGFYSIEDKRIGVAAVCSCCPSIGYTE